MSHHTASLLQRALASTVFVSVLLLVGPAGADPIFTDKGNFIDNRVKGTVTLTTPGGTKASQPSMIKEVRKPGSATEAMVHSAAPFVDYTEAQKTAINRRVTDTYAGVTVTKDPDPSYDCHGLTFKSGKQFINNDQVQKIIDDQGWKAPADGKAKVGDIVIYKKGGAITHSGLVTEVNGAGAVTKVHSKWGPWGEYTHAPDDVPKGQAAFGGVDYGTAEVLTGGKPLKDPPIADDLKIFERLPIVTMKPGLLDQTAINIFPVAELAFSGALGGAFSYTLDIPDIGLRVSPGDMLTLFAAELLDGFVSGEAASGSFGGWRVVSVAPDQVSWQATVSAFLDDDVSGFSVQSLLENIGTALYRETVAGSVGIVDGPAQVPVPATLVLLSAALLSLAVGRHARRCSSDCGEAPGLNPGPERGTS